MCPGQEDQPMPEPSSSKPGPAEAASRHDAALASIARKPDDLDAILELAAAMLSMGGGGIARCHLAEAAERCETGDARWMDIRLTTARICHNEGLPEEALELLDGLERIASPKIAAKIRFLRCKSHIRAGQLEEARKGISEIARAGQLDIAAQVMFAELENAEGNHEKARQRFEVVLGNPRIPALTRASTEFMLTNSLNRIGEYDLAFEAAIRANEALAVEFDVDAFEEETERILEWSTPERIKSLPLSSDREERSVFIVGMPRSGTSLLEQIISAHPSGEGIGERFEFNMFHTLLEHRTGLPNPDCIHEGDNAMFDDFAAAYRRMEKSIAPTGNRVTNKALGLDTRLPLVSRVLPGSRAILLRRRPLDNLVSIFMNPINPDQLPWACSMEGLVAGRRRFDRLAERWHELLDIETMPIDYEEIVDDAERRIREILQFLDMDFDQSAVDFHDSGRVVMTPSWDQVNQPINRNAVDRWRRYERHIGPLIEAFGE